MKEIIDQALTKSFSYSDYKQHIITLYERGEVTGGEATEEMLNYTELNIARMTRLEKSFHPENALIDALKLLPDFQIVVLTEGWCGDAAQQAGAYDLINKAVNEREARYVLRDRNLELMDLFLTNGKSRSIPIAIFWTGSEVLFHYGPRPKPAQQVLDTMKNSGADLQAQKTELHKWYARDKWATMQQELLNIVTDKLSVVK